MLKIIERNVSELKPYENNPRLNDAAVDKVAESIKQFGFKNPIIIDKEDVIVCGHTRLKAAEKLGLDKVPTIKADDLTDEQIKAFRIIENKTAEYAEWDFTKLELELKNIDEIDMGEFDFHLEDFDEPIEVIEDEIPSDADIEPQVKKGDIWQLGEHFLMCGDSTSEEDVKTLVGNAKMDMIFTDPPYNVDYEGLNGMKIQNDKKSDLEFFDFLTAAFNNMANVTKEGGSIYVCYADIEVLNFATAFINAGFKLSASLVWVKNHIVLGRKDYQWKHEPILYGWKEGAGHYFVDDRTQSTVWEYDKPQKSELHPTMKPIELVVRAIQNSSKRGWNVLDLFGGSGSTLIACEQTGRRCFTMELDEHYCDVIIARYEALTGYSAVKIN